MVGLVDYGSFGWSVNRFFSIFIYWIAVGTIREPQLDGELGTSLLSWFSADHLFLRQLGFARWLAHLSLVLIIAAFGNGDGHGLRVVRPCVVVAGATTLYLIFPWTTGGGASIRSLGALTRHPVLLIGSLASSLLGRVEWCGGS